MQPHLRPSHLSFDWNREALERFVYNNPELALDRDPSGHIKVILPAVEQHFQNHLSIYMLLWDWHLSNGNLGFVMDLGRHFFLPCGQVLKPDGAWVKNDTWQQLSDLHRHNIPPISPDFVVEIRSPMATLRQQMEKVQAWSRAGSQLVWLVDVFEKQVIYQCYADGTVNIHRLAHGPLSINNLLPGFTLDPRQLIY